MFSVTAWNCATGYFSFGHEIGHNMGCNHDKGTSNACSNSNYNYGWRDPQAQFRSILAYNCNSGQCDNNAGGGCTRVQRFSNPNYLYNGKAIGSPEHDNARRINDVKATIAAYYTSVPAGPTSSPTPAPTVAPCTSSADCNDGDDCTIDTCNTSTGECTNTPNPDMMRDVIVSITTDNYPTETSWKITSNDSTNMSGSGYTQAGQTYTETESLCIGLYKFTIQDEYGDGICCGYGQGGYTVTVENEVVVEGGEFASEESKEFSIDGSPTSPVSPPTTSPVSPPTTSPVSSPPSKSPVSPPTTSPVSSPPSNSPVSPPTTSPVPPPTTSPVSSPENCESFIFSLTTDHYGYEVSFTLTDYATGKIRFAGGEYDSDMTFNDKACLTNGRYIFKITDSYGDGICCGDQGDGIYKVTVGENQVTEGGAFGFSEETIFDVGPPGPSSAPTPAPTCLASNAGCMVGDQCCSGRCNNGACN